MSLQSQTKNMKLLSVLLGQDLGYIYGEREDGPNGAKKQFLTTGRAFLSALGRDLGLAQQKVHTNNAGIASSGEVYLRGMWGPSGVKLELSQDPMHGRCLSYRYITDMRDTSGIYTSFVTLAELRNADYVALLENIMSLNGESAYGRKAA